LPPSNAPYLAAAVSSMNSAPDVAVYKALKNETEIGFVLQLDQLFYVDDDSPTRAAARFVRKSLALS
jgi:hypothetical protein